MAREGVIKASRRNPCPICGSIDWDMWAPSFNGVGHAFFCHRAGRGGKCNVIGADGRNYIYIKEAGKGGDLYFEEEDYKISREMWLAEHGYTVKDFDSGKIQEYKEAMLNRYKSVVPMNVKTDKVKEADKLDIVYRAFLTLLELDDVHEKSLRNEWGDYYNGLTSKHMIRSIPITDKMRYDLGKFYVSKNAWRKNIVLKLIELIGDEEKLRGVPGFFKKNGAWTFANISGMVFPVPDAYGRIVRIRVKDNFPNVKGEFNGQSGIYYFDFKELSWYFIEKEANRLKEYNKAVCVFPLRNPGRALIKLTKDNVPPGKVSAKYKNFTSYTEKYDEVLEEWINPLEGGSRSGSVCGIYMSEDDDCGMVLATEGEKKAMVINHILSVPSITVPGVGLYEYINKKGDCGEPSILEVLIQRGVKKFVIVYDADKAVNEEVLRNEREFIEFMRSQGIDAYVGEWDARFGKGADDALLNGVSVDVYEYLEIAA